MTTTFFFLRHAAHDNVGQYLAGRSPGVRLGPAGRAQAFRLGERMQRERFDVIAASPRERTQETAQAVSVACGVGPVVTRDELDEIDFGCWSGKTFAELNEDDDWRIWNQERGTARTPASECVEQVRERVCACMGDLAQKHPDAGVVMVSHADVIKAAVCHVLGLPGEAGFRFDIEPGSITVIVMGGWGSKLLRLNEGAS